MSGGVRVLTFLTEVLAQTEPGVFQHVDWMRPKGSAQWGRERWILGESDVAEDEAKRIWLRSGWSRRIPDIPVPSFSGLMRVPALSPVAFRLATSAALALLMGRWIRGAWPLERHNRRRSASEVCGRIGVDAGHMSRVVAGESAFSVENTDRVLRFGQFRLSFIPARERDNDEDPVERALLRYLASSEPNAPWWMRQQPADERVPHRWMQELSLAWTTAPTGYSASHRSRLRRGEREFSWDSLANFAQEFGVDLLVVPESFPIGWSRPEMPGGGQLPPTALAAPRSSFGIFARGRLTQEHASERGHDEE